MDTTALAQDASVLSEITGLPEKFSHLIIALTFPLDVQKMAAQQIAPLFYTDEWLLSEEYISYLQSYYLNMAEVLKLEKDPEKARETLNEAAQHWCSGAIKMCKFVSLDEYIRLEEPIHKLINEVLANHAGLGGDDVDVDADAEDDYHPDDDRYDY